MNKVKVLEIRKSIYESNDAIADEIRERMQKSNTFLVNLMSSPGSGKTTTLVNTLDRLKDKLKIAVMEADIDSDVDAKTIANIGVEAIQLHTGGMCHLDAGLARDGLDNLNDDNYDMIILENVGNLVCPASFKLGETKNIMILSVPEGDDKPLKYPHMFEIVDLLIINKIDTIGVFDFSIEAVNERVSALNPNIKIIPISAKTGEGVQELADWLYDEAMKIQKN